MKQKIKEYVLQQGLITPGDVIIVAVSGGADSVCMLHIMKELCGELNITLRAVHVEHGIRGAESFADAEFTKSLCEKLGVDLDTVHVDVPQYAKRKGLGEEEAARKLRYDVLNNTARIYGAKIALAHHMEDNAETVIFQMLRGSGIKGLSGIAPIREEYGICYIRPLLCVRRSEIEEYLAQIRQRFCLDRTNFDVKYSRNRLRNNVFPELEKINSKGIEHINKTANQMIVTYDYLKEQAQNVRDEITNKQNKYISINKDKMRSVHPAIRGLVILSILEEACGKRKDITSVHVEEVLSLAKKQSGRKVDLPYGMEAKSQYGEIVIRHRDKEKTKENLFIEISPEQFKKLTKEKIYFDLKKDKKLEVSVFEFDGNTNKIPKKPYTKWVDYDKIKDSFWIRTRLSGDYFVNGVLRHKKKLKQYFIDEKIPSEERDDIILVAKKSEIVCIMGGRVGENYKVDENTKRVIEFNYCGG